MKKEKNPIKTNLRQKAEEKFKPLQSLSANQPVKLLEVEALKLIHELEVHQIELEMQNDELEQAKALAIAESAKYTELYDFAPSGYFTLSPTGEISGLNLTAANMLGKERLLLKKRPLGFYISSETKPVFSDFLEKVFQSKVKEDCELAISENGNSEMWVHLSGIASENGQQCFITAVDITERRLAANKLQAEQSFRSSIELSLRSGIAIVDDNGRQIYVNPFFCKLVGWTEEDLLGKIAPFVYWPTDQLQAINEAFRHTLTGVAPQEGFELEFVRKDGIHFPALVIISPFSNGKQRTGWLANVIDITKHKLAEEALQKSESNLRELNATKDKFFSIIAHDLKSPFNSIIGFSEILVEQIQENDYEGIEKYAGIIYQSSHRAVDLLANLMEWARSQTGRMDFKPEILELGDVISEVVELLSDAALKKAITISTKLPVTAIAKADRPMISTVLRNLLANAIKFTRPGGEIIISTLENQSGLTVSVTDNGIGIPRNLIDKLFRLDVGFTTQGTEKEQGTGLGLILCKEFIEKHGGKIWAESTEGVGSTFCFILPG
jgi:PAS domain S-box-containing protein